MVATLSTEWRYSHWCAGERHQASIIEFENRSSVASGARLGQILKSVPAFAAADAGRLE
jgi:hypothetical protein